MCFSSTPDIKTPDQPQEQKAPDLAAIKKSKKANATMGGGTLLTGPSGIESSTSAGATTLLGS